VPAGRFGVVNSELPFARHRATGSTGGRVFIGFADGHADLLSQETLVREDGRSSYVALWTPIDHRLEP
jgi:hypothetical protein